MESMNELAMVWLVSLLAAISPGADFAMVSSNSYLYGRKAGMQTAFGIACAIWVHVAYAVLGVAVLVQTSPWLLQALKTIGALYLAYVGWKTWRHQAVVVNVSRHQDGTASWVSMWKTGFVSNALNPKTTLFVLSLFGQVVTVNTPLWYTLVCGGMLSLAHLLWFVWVAVVLSKPAIRDWLLQQQAAVNKTICGLFFLLAGLLWRA